MSPLPQSINFLVADDSGVMRRIIIRALKRVDAVGVIHEASGGSEAWDVLEAEDIDFIISDWKMPGMTGLQLLQKVRSCPRFAHLPFLMVTAEAKFDDTIRAVESGVSNYLTKPFKDYLLQQKVEKILSHQATP